MGKIIVYNTHYDDYTSMPNNYYIGRNKCNNILSNPFTFNGVKTNLAKLSFKTREEALKGYEQYFDKMYGYDEEFTKKIDEIYEHYKKGEDIYLQCFCKPKACHGDIIAEKLQQRLMQEQRQFHKVHKSFK